MKITCLLLFVSMPARSQMVTSAPIATPGSVAGQPAAAQPPSLMTWLGDAVKTVEADSAFNLQGQKYGAAYKALRTLDVPVANAFDAGGGAVFGAGKPEGLVSVRVNLPALADGLFDLGWFKRNTHGDVLPDFFLGPSLKAEWPIRDWTWKKDTFLLLGIPISSVGGLSQ